MKNIIFDWSGVIKDALTCHLWVVNRMFNKFNVDTISLGELKKNWREPYMHFYNKYIPGLTLEEEQKLYKEGLLDKDCPPPKSYPRIIELIKKLKSNNYFLAVVSSDLSVTLHPEIKNFGLEYAFNTTVVSVQDKTREIQKLISKYKLNPKETYFIGDSNHEIQVSRKVGINSIAVTWGFTSEEDLKKENPDYIVHNIKELEKVLINSDKHNL